MFDRLFSKPQEQKPKLEGLALVEQVMREAGQLEIDPQKNRNAQGELLAENGKVSHLPELYWRIVRTPSFQEWFAKSVVRDENGEPKVVYRASLDKVSEINPEGEFHKAQGKEWKTVVSEDKDIDEGKHLGIFFTSKRNRAIDWFRENFLYDNVSQYYLPPEEREVLTPEEEEVFLKGKEEFLKDYGDQIRITSAFIRLENPFVEQGFNNKNIQHGLVSIGDFRQRYNKGGRLFEKKLQKYHDGLYIPIDSDFGDQYAVVKQEDIMILPNILGEGQKIPPIKDPFEAVSSIASTQQKEATSPVLLEVVAPRSVEKKSTPGSKNVAGLIKDPRIPQPDVPKKYVVPQTNAERLARIDAEILREWEDSKKRENP